MARSTGLYNNNNDDTDDRRSGAPAHRVGEKKYWLRLSVCLKLEVRRFDGSEIFCVLSSYRFTLEKVHARLNAQRTQLSRRPRSVHATYRNPKCSSELASQTFSATGELWPSQWAAGLASSKKLARSHAFCFHKVTISISVIHRLSTGYPHTIHTLSTCCLSYEKRMIERILRCRHGPTGPRSTARVRLLEWDSHAYGCHT